MEFTMYPVLPASDLNRAARWYREKMGLVPVGHGGEPIPTGEMPEEFDSQLLYDTGTAKFAVYESQHAGRNQATATRLVTTDFEGAFAELTERGVEFEEYDFGDDFRTEAGVLTSPDGERTCWFKDSEGNILALGSSD
jgi:catechol 2,3-dioxygenase-like lactoylglutathione lyase family enzyme